MGAQEGKTIDEAYAACKQIGDHNFSFSNFVTSETVAKILAWRPGLFPKGFSVDKNSFVTFGLPVTVREEVLSEIPLCRNVDDCAKLGQVNVRIARCRNVVYQE